MAGESEPDKQPLEKDIVRLQWMNSNPDVEVIASEETTDYYTYHTAAGGNIVAKAFKRILYKNLYRGIDVEYIFHPQLGIKYTVTVHSGADASVIKMSVDGGSGQAFLDNLGNLHLPTLFGHFIDHAPFTTYKHDENYKHGGYIKSEFVLSGNVVSFKLQAPNPLPQTIIIDPWLVNPAMANSNKAWEIECDGSGNAYVYGGDSPLKLKKYNSAGALQWTYSSPWDTASVWVGTLKTDPSGNSYITAGSIAEIIKVNTGGSWQWQNGGGAFSMDEYWSLTFNCDYTQLIAGGTRLVGLFTITGDGKAYNINLSNGSIISSVTVAKTVAGFIIRNPNEIRSICASPNGKYYFHTLDTIGELTKTMTVNWGLLTSYTYAYGSPSYGFTPQGQHSIAASSNYIYTLQGSTITRRNIADGSIVNSATIPGGGYTTGIDGIAPNNSGIDIDSCGYVYVGSQSQVHKFDAALNLVSSAASASAVYDVAIGTNGNIYACGNGFAQAIAMTACAPRQPVCVTSFLASASATSVPCKGQCSATATATPIGGTSPFSYSWSNSQNTSTATGLCAGAYSVTITDGSNSTATATVTVTEPSLLMATATATNVGCQGGNNGAAAVIAAGGSSPYTYFWSNGGNISSISGLTTGTYYVTVTDSHGCTKTSSATVTNPPPLNIKRDYYICEAGSVMITAYGGTSYTWSPGNSLSDSTIANPVASPFITTTYTVTIHNGTCTDTATVTVHMVNPPAPPTISQLGDSLWVPQGWAGYQWYFNGGPIGGATKYYYIAGQTGIYSVQLTDTNGCRVTTSGLYVITSAAELQTDKQGMLIVPNPAKNEFTVYGPGLTPGPSPKEWGEGNSLEIYNVLGEKIYQSSFDGRQKTISCNWSAGVYLVRMVSNNSSRFYTEKLVIE